MEPVKLKLSNSDGTFQWQEPEIISEESGDSACHSVIHYSAECHRAGLHPKTALFLARILEPDPTKLLDVAFKDLNEMWRSTDLDPITAWLARDHPWFYIAGYRLVDLLLKPFNL